MNQTDEIADLIARVALSDQKAFKVLYERTSAKLFGICLRILRDTNDSQAVLQDVYVKVWHKADSFSAGRARGITWLAAIARHTAIDEVRARKPASLAIDEMYDLADKNPGPEDSIIAASEHRRVIDCLDELAQEHAAMVRQTYLNGWTYQQAADYAGIPLNTAKTWIRRSLLSLRDCLQR